MSGFCAPFSSQCVDTARGCKSLSYAPYPLYCCMTFTTVNACSLLRHTGLVDPQLLVVTCGPRPRQCSCSARDAKQVRRPAVMNCPRRQGGGCPWQRGGDGRAAPLWTLEARRLERTDVARQHGCVVRAALHLMRAIIRELAFSCASVYRYVLRARCGKAPLVPPVGRATCSQELPQGFP